MSTIGITTTFVSIACTIILPATILCEDAATPAQLYLNTRFLRKCCTNNDHDRDYSSIRLRPNYTSDVYEPLSEPLSDRMRFHSPSRVVTMGRERSRRTGRSVNTKEEPARTRISCDQTCLSKNRSNETDSFHENGGTPSSVPTTGRNYSNTDQTISNTSRNTSSHTNSNTSDNTSSSNTTVVDAVSRNGTADRCCDSIFTSLNFWGANIVIFANAIYIIPYLIVLIAFLLIPALRVRAYDKAVLCYNVSQIILNGILIGLGICVLCRISVYPRIHVSLGLAIMFLTISSTFWLFVICFDMTLAITRFRWAPPSAATKSEERTKFWVYAAWAWGGSFLPTVFATVVELSPLLPKSSPLRPNFQRFNDGVNYAVVVYVALLPALACLANTILFCYTTYRMMVIRKSTAIATANSTVSTKTIKEKYLVYLRLYFLMDAPWVTSAIAAAFNDFWILKFLRMIQPILMLMAILPHRTITQPFVAAFAFGCCVFSKSDRADNLNQDNRCKFMRCC